MASKTSSNLLQTSSKRRVSNAHPTLLPSSKPAPPSSLPSIPAGRRQLLSLLTATTVLKAVELPSRAQDIPLFGLRKKLKKVEEEAEEIVKEGIESAERGLESAEKGLESAEKGLESAEKGLESAEKEIEAEVSFGGGFVQAGVVAGAEVVGVLVATSVVNGILGPEAQKS